MPEPEPYELALRALGQKERTEAELAGWLRERGVEETELHEAIARLAEAGALDDERFARRFAEDKRELRGWGPDRIAEALRGRGVEESLIAAALAAEEPEATVARAVEVLEEGGRELGDEAGRNRALALLARRGYPLEVAYDAVRAFERNG
ncbi:MAG TPA: RecX family transcriptional regulator [Solirubrobacterales bacterium]|nr:RecX family transcriptional regulator [Solirubrobacterales bacterium]